MVDCVYLGPVKNSASYRFLVYKSNVKDISNNTIIEFGEAEFFDIHFLIRIKMDKFQIRVLDDALSQDQLDNTSEVPQENAKPKRSKRAKVNKGCGPDYVINQTKKMLHSSFDMKDMGEDDVILGIRIQNNSKGYILAQSHYIDDRPVVTPFDPKKMLHSSFDMKDMGEDDVILGIRIQNNSKGYILAQSHYIDDRPVVTPFDPKV
nr:dynamin-related protein 4C-like [Tanacetum cinerariifolium]